MSRARIKRLLSAFPAATLQHLGLLIVFVLLMVARDFATAHPALASILIFIFSLGYLAHRMVGARPARSCEIATADVFCERYRRRRSIVYLRARVAFESSMNPKALELTQH